MATAKLLGLETASIESGALGAEYILMWRWQAAATGNVTEIKWKPRESGHGKFCIYTDAAGAPGTLLNQTAEYDMTADVVNTIAIPSTTVVSGTYYWLAVMQEGNSQGFYFTSSSSGTYKYKTLAYASGFPNPAGSGYVDLTYDAYIAGYGILVLSPSSISQPVSYGSPKLNLSIKPSSLVQALACGMPAVLTAALIIQPPSIVQVVAIGTPALRYPQIILPSSIVQPVAVGTPWIGIFGFIRPQSTIQQISIGSPTILKYVWHVILDGQYATETPEVNRAYIIGRDQYGNPVYGSAIESSEVDLVGERLDFQQEIAVPTESQAAGMASAILAKMRLTKARGVILVPPNCGQELFDVVEISDSGANQSAVNFRVVGFRFEYNTRQAVYQHRLILGNP
jgi:hypothetical protein